MSLADPKTIFVCSLVRFELVFGAFKSAKTAENLELLESFFASTQSLPFDDKAAAIAGEVRAHLTKTGKNMGPTTFKSLQSHSQTT
ncbi:MAG TPA: hypothetical protein VKX17_26515 [Planctomycetota bacterium]|nr:hypothetical protein [Planctomycetota bacterium]